MAVKLFLRHIQPPACPHHMVFCHTLVYKPASLNGVKDFIMWGEGEGGIHHVIVGGASEEKRN